MNEIYLKNIGVPLRTISKVKIFEGVGSGSLEKSLEKSFSENVGFDFSSAFGNESLIFQFPFADCYNLIENDTETLFPIFLQTENNYVSKFHQGFSEVLTLSELGIDEIFYSQYLSQLEEFGFDEESYSQHYLGGFKAVRGLLSSNNNLNLNSVQTILNGFKVDENFMNLAKMIFPEFSKKLEFKHPIEASNLDSCNIISLFGNFKK